MRGSTDDVTLATLSAAVTEPQTTVLLRHYSKRRSFGHLSHVLDVHCSEPIVGNGDIENRQLEYLAFVVHVDMCAVAKNTRAPQTYG